MTRTAAPTGPGRSSTGGAVPLAIDNQYLDSGDLVSLWLLAPATPETRRPHEQVEVTGWAARNTQMLRQEDLTPALLHTPRP